MDRDKKLKKLTDYIDQLVEKEGNNSITKTISKSMDFDIIMPSELKEHRQTRDRIKNLAFLAAKQAQSKQLQSINKRTTL